MLNRSYLYLSKYAISLTNKIGAVLSGGPIEQQMFVAKFKYKRQNLSILKQVSIFLQQFDQF